jgi:hypothetical protein
MSCYGDHWYDQPGAHVAGIFLVVGLAVAGILGLALWIEAKDHQTQIATAEARQDLKDIECQVCGGHQMTLSYCTWSANQGCRLFVSRCQRCSNFWFIKLPPKAEAP